VYRRLPEGAIKKVPSVVRDEERKKTATKERPSSTSNSGQAEKGASKFRKREKRGEKSIEISQQKRREKIFVGNKNKGKKGERGPLTLSGKAHEEGGVETTRKKGEAFESPGVREKETITLRGERGGRKEGTALRRRRHDKLKKFIPVRGKGKRPPCARWRVCGGGISTL